ncbi:MAG: cupin domain-containing protein [Myxococcota bacterium]
MHLHADFRERVVLHTPDIAWVASPMAGVDRRMLDRIGDEVARATSVVRYAPGSRFSSHVHGGGEEFIVLEGVFQDEHGDYPVGTYVRNPPTSSHTPGSEPGCTIFVKLRQFQPEDRRSVRVQMDAVARHTDPTTPDFESALLFEDEFEKVQFQVWAPSAARDFVLDGGAELLVLDGEITQGGTHLGRHSWLRLPVGSRLDAVAGPAGARVWMKTGHLRSVSAG